MRITLRRGIASCAIPISRISLTPDTRDHAYQGVSLSRDATFHSHYLNARPTMSIGTSYQARFVRGSYDARAFEWRRSNHFDNRVVSILSQATYLFIYATRKLQERPYLFACVGDWRA